MFVFQYGNFSAESTAMTYPLLQVFSLSIFSLALNTYVTRFYYALENTLLPNLLNIISVFGINILVIVLFIESWGASAIAFGTVVSTIINMLLLVLFAQRQLGLTVSNWNFIIKLIIFVLFVVGVLLLAYQLTAGYVLVSLLVGGMLTLLLAFLALRFIH